jgi:hypothetical protein
MNRKLVLTTAVTSVLLVSMLAAVQFVKETGANFSPEKPIITIISPISDQTYNTNSITLILSIRTIYDYFDDSNNGTGSRAITYSLDGQTPVKMVDSLKREGIWSTVVSEETIADLTNGMHILEITATNNYSAWSPTFILSSSKSCSFSIEAPLPSPTASPPSTPPIRLDIDPPSPLPLIVLIVLVVAIIGILVYLRKLGK